MVSAQGQRQEEEWAALMRVAQQGDAHSYERLLRAITPFLRSLVRRYCREPQRQDDVVQDVLLTVHRVRHTWDPARPFCPWLAAIAGRRCIDLLRRESRITRHELANEALLVTFADPSPNSDEGLDHSFADIAPFLASLPPRQRQALEALKVRGQSLREASRDSGQSVTALKVNMHRAVKTLRRLLRVDPT